MALSLEGHFLEEASQGALAEPDEEPRRWKPSMLASSSVPFSQRHGNLECVLALSKSCTSMHAKLDHENDQAGTSWLYTTASNIK